jgi:signal transduction histidine kinase
MTQPPAPETAPAPAARRIGDPFRWIIENPVKVDLVIFGTGALLVLLFALGTGSYGWWTVFTVPMIASAAVCRVRPGLGVGLIGGLAVLHVLLAMPVVGGDVLTFYALFCAVAYGRPAVHVAGVVAGFLGTLVQSLTWGVITSLDPYGSVGQGIVVFVSLMVVGSITVTAVWALANLQRARVRQLELSREAAEQAVREREQRTALAVADERARIAREMHDVVAHSLSVIIAQADGGRYVAAQKPEQAVDVLGTIGETGRTALADMRSLLGVLRHEDETSFGPQPGPEMLGDLVERVRTAGLRVSLEVQGDLQGIPQAIGMSLFRLVQEALTNVLKHAGAGAAAAVRITRRPGLLEVEVIDDGRGVDPDSDGQGHGITGMRERMAVFGGELDAGPLPGRGFRVRARLPLPGGAHPGGALPDSARPGGAQPDVALPDGTSAETVPLPRSYPSPAPSPAPSPSLPPGQPR